MATQDCIQECNNIRYNTATQTLEGNNNCINSFCNSIRTLLNKGKEKFGNILITGPTNSKMFNTLDNPATSSFTWVGTVHKSYYLRISAGVEVAICIILLFEPI